MEHFVLPSNNQLIHSLLDLLHYFHILLYLPNKQNKLLVRVLRTGKTNYHMDDLNLGCSYAIRHSLFIMVERVRKLYISICPI